MDNLPEVDNLPKTVWLYPVQMLLEICDPWPESLKFFFLPTHGVPRHAIAQRFQLGIKWHWKGVLVYMIVQYSATIRAEKQLIRMDDLA